MSDEKRPESFMARRFAKFGDPKDHNPIVVLDVAREWIEAQDFKPDHIIVLIGRTTDDNGSGTKYLQAGNYPHHAQMGLIAEGTHMIRESGRDG